jgi:zinc protease
VIIAGDAKAFAEPLKALAPDLQIIPAARLDLDSPSLMSARP